MNRLTVLRGYYAATLVFVVLDYFFNVNVRLSFLDAWPAARALYYLLCFACLALIVWRPAWSLLVGTVESLLALSLLIIGMGVRVMTVSDQLLTGGVDPVAPGEILNFAIVGGAAWISWDRGMFALRQGSGRPR